MPARTPRTNSGAVASPSRDNKKRALDDSQESAVSSRRSKRARPSVDNPPSAVPASQPSRKPGRQVSVNSNSRVSPVDIKKENLLEGDDLEIPVLIKKQKVSIAADLDAKVKQEIEIEEEEIAAKSTKKRKTKAEKEAEMLPLAARTKGLQMFVGAHVSAAKGWSIPSKFHFNALSIGQEYRIPSSTVST